MPRNEVAVASASLNDAPVAGAAPLKSASCHAPPPLRRKIDYESLLSNYGRELKSGVIRSLVTGFMGKPGVVSLAGGLPPAAVFPIEEITMKLRDGTVVSVPDVDLGQQYNLTMNGLPALVSWAADLTARQHSPACTVETALTNGANNAVEALVRMLCDAGDCIALEAYHYPVMSENFARPAGVEVLGIQSDQQGLIPEALEAALAARRAAGLRMPKLLYTNPVAQNPTGGTITPARMREVYAICSHYGLLIVEDDPYYYLQYPLGSDAVPGTLLPPGYLSLDGEGRVLRVDTFSKMLIPGLRLGWVSGPAPLVTRLTCHLAGSSTGPNTLTAVMAQGLLEAWGRAGFDTHVRRVQAHYAAAAAACHAAAKRHLDGLADWTEPLAGMFLWLTLRDVEDVMDIWSQLQDARVVVVPGSAVHAQEGTRSPCLRVAFSYASPQQVEEGLKRLGAVVRAATSADVASLKLDA